MNIHEYQAKEIFRRHGIPVPPGEVATTPAEAEQIARRFGGTVVVKAQVHAGGRGKAGGVKLAKSPAEAREIAARILGMQIKGLTVSKVLVTAAAEIASEAYVGVILDRASSRPLYEVDRSAHFGCHASLPERALSVQPLRLPYLQRAHRALAGLAVVEVDRIDVR